MSKIKNMIAKESSTWVTFPEIEGFEVNLRFLTREDLLKIRTASSGWRGLRVKHLPLLLPVDISSMDPEENIEYSEEEALELLKNSTIFDQFVTDTMNDFEQFSKTKAETDSKN
jgi:hypothetical protein